MKNKMIDVMTKDEIVAKLTGKDWEKWLAQYRTEALTESWVKVKQIQQKGMVVK